MTGCRIYATRAEKAFIESPQLEGGFLWGGFTVKALKNKFFEAKPSTVTDILDEDQMTAEDIHVVGLPGHFFQMAGFITADKVAYLGDAMVGDQILEKYKIPYIYDVEQYKETIEKIKCIDADYFVLSHGGVEEEITRLADRNLEKVYEVEEIILEAASEKRTFEGILQKTCGKLGVCLEIAQYALIGNTVRSFLSYLSNHHLVRYEFIDNTMYWEKT
jgi:glyoxylase-like metal-dependent hydrolase (beta-lactamase superfamily II)